MPGFDALVSLSKGLGISLDWLVFGLSKPNDRAELLANKATTEKGLKYFEGLHNRMLRELGEKGDPNLLFGQTPEEWAASLGHEVGERVREMNSSGVTLGELLTWKASLHEQLSEQIWDRFEHVGDAKHEEGQ